MTYEMDIAGLKRDLPLCKVSDDLYIGAFVMFGDVELTVHCAAELLKLTPEYDYLIAPEAKAIPLVYEMARQSGADKYFVARKKAKAYMSSVFQVHVKSITTQGVQTLVVEETPMLGGMLTAQGVCATDGNFNLPSGLWNEFRDHLRKRYGGIGALWTGWVSTTLFEPHVADSIFHTMAAAEPTLEVVHGYRLTGILRRGKRVTGAEFTDARGGRMLVRQSALE